MPNIIAGRFQEMDAAAAVFSLHAIAGLAWTDFDAGQLASLADKDSGAVHLGRSQ